VAQKYGDFGIPEGCYRNKKRAAFRYENISFDIGNPYFFIKPKLMLFPIGDDQVRGGHFPWLSYGFIALCILMFIVQMQTPSGLFCEWGAIPNDILQGRHLSTLFTSIFLHSNFQHLLGNMLFLWVFADNIEANVNHRPFLVFFLLGGAIAAMSHVFAEGNFVESYCCAICEENVAPCNGDYCSGSIPMIGASGAISAVMGAYLVMFPKSRIKLLFLFFFFRLPAFVFLIFWILLQLNNGLGIFGDGGGSVAWWAHIGGFAFGLLAGLYFRNHSSYIGLGKEPEVLEEV